MVVGQGVAAAPELARGLHYTNTTKRPIVPLPCLSASASHSKYTPGERLHVLDLDNDGLITEKELTDALTFLKANLDDQDLKALLEK